MVKPATRNKNILMQDTFSIQNCISQQGHLLVAGWIKIIKHAVNEKQETVLDVIAQPSVWVHQSSSVRKSNQTFVRTYWEKNPSFLVLNSHCKENCSHVSSEEQLFFPGEGIYDK